MKYLLACATDTGIKKSVNQDSVLLKRAISEGRQIVLAVMCDGMGGLKKGEVASASLAKAFSKWFEEELPSFLTLENTESAILRSWNQMILRMNEKIREYGRRGGLQLGTTLTAVLFLEKEYYVVHVGDSRAYEITDQIYQLTKDQTLVQREVDQGRLTTQEAMNDVRRSVLLQCIGVAEEVEPVYAKGDIAADAVYLLCCDGFRHVLSSQEIQSLLNPQYMTSEAVLERTLERMIEMNKKRGEQDNISAIAVRTWQGEE